MAVQWSVIYRLIIYNLRTRNVFPPKNQNALKKMYTVLKILSLFCSIQTEFNSYNNANKNTYTYFYKKKVEITDVPQLGEKYRLKVYA